MLKNFLWKNKIAVAVCVLTVAFGIGWWALSSPGTTSIGENITVGSNLYVSGNVGIGTAGPGAKLDVAGTTWTNALNVSDRTLANGQLSISSGWDGVIRINPGTAATMFFNREAGATKDFHVWNGVSTEVFTILGASGNVGIGTTNPSQKLDVSGQIHASGDICTDVGGGVCLSSGGGGGTGGSVVTVDSESNTLLVNHAYKAQTAGFVYALGSTYAANNKVYVSSGSNPAGSSSNQLGQSHLGEGTGFSSSVIVFVPKDYYFEVTTGGSGTDPSIRWQPLVSGGGNPIDYD